MIAVESGTKFYKELGDLFCMTVVRQTNYGRASQPMMTQQSNAGRTDRKKVSKGKTHKNLEILTTALL